MLIGIRFYGTRSIRLQLPIYARTGQLPRARRFRSDRLDAEADVATTVPTSCLWCAGGDRLLRQPMSVQAGKGGPKHSGRVIGQKVDGRGLQISYGGSSVDQLVVVAWKPLVTPPVC